MSEKSHKIRNAFEHIAKQASPILKRFWIPKRSPSDPKEAAGAETEQQTAINNVHHAGHPVPLVESCYDEPDATREGNDTYQKQKEDNHNEVNWEKRNFWATVVLTLLLLFVSIFGVYFAQDIGYQQNVIANKQAEIANTQADIANKQLKEMESGSEDTKKLAQAAVNQADATKAIAESANTQANAALALAGASQEQRQEMANQSGLMADSLTELRKSVNVAQRSVDIASETLQISERPYLVAISATFKTFEANKILEVQVLFRNTGRSPAHRTVVKGGLQFVKVENVNEPCVEPKLTNVLGLTSRAVVPANITAVSLPNSVKPISEMDFKRFQRKEWWIYVYAVVSYESFTRKKHLSSYFARYDPVTGTFQTCDIGNDAN